MVIGRVTDAMAAIVGGDDDGRERVYPTDDDVVERAAAEAGVETARVAELAEAVQEVLDAMYPQLAEEAETLESDGRGNQPDEGFLYAFQEGDDVLVIGGAAGVLTGIGDRLGLAQVEVEAVRQAHRIAANMNGYARHVVMDDAVIARDRGLTRPEAEVEDLHQNEIADAVEGLSDDGYPLPDTGFVRDLGLDEEKYVGVSVAFEEDGVALTLDPSDRTADYHGVVVPTGDVRVTPALGRGLALRRRDVEWSTGDGGITARFAPLTTTVPGGRQTKLVQRDGWQGHVPSDALRRADLDVGDEAAVVADAAGEERLLVVVPETGDDAATGAVAQSGVGTERTVVEIPEEVAAVLGMDSGNVNVVWDVDDGRLVASLF